MTKRLTKQELLDSIKSRVAEKRPDLTKADVEAVSDVLWETIRKELADGNVVPIQGFGIFEPKESAERAVQGAIEWRLDAFWPKRRIKQAQRPTGHDPKKTFG